MAGDTGNIFTNSNPTSGSPIETISTVASTQLIAKLELFDYTSDFKKIETALPGTCGWIGKKLYFQR
jgi:hypothetical protein